MFGPWCSLSSGSQFPLWPVLRANVQVALGLPLQPQSDPFSSLSVSLPMKWDSGSLHLGLALLRGNVGGKRMCDQLHPFLPCRHHLCRSRHYCRDVGNSLETLYAQVERLVQQANHQADSSVSLYYFNASLYLLRVLKGNTAEKFIRQTQKKEKAGTHTSTKPKGPEVSRPWPRKAQPRKSWADRYGQIPAAGLDHLPIFTGGELRQ